MGLLDNIARGIVAAQMVPVMAEFQRDLNVMAEFQRDLNRQMQEARSQPRQITFIEEIRMHYPVRAVVRKSKRIERHYPLRAMFYRIRKIKRSGIAHVVVIRNKRRVRTARSI